MIRFSCPVCRKKLKAPERGAGREIRCPHCGQWLLIPALHKVESKPIVSQPELALVPSGVPDPVSQAPVVPFSPPPTGIKVPECFLEAPKEVVFAPPPVRQEPKADHFDFDKSEWTNGGEPIHQREFSKRGSNDGGFAGGCLRLIGASFVFVGLCLILYFCMIYDTTVPADAYAPILGRVHNIGLLQNRMIGIIVGFGFAFLGIAFCFLGKRNQPSS